MATIHRVYDVYREEQGVVTRILRRIIKDKKLADTESSDIEPGRGTLAGCGDNPWVVKEPTFFFRFI